MNQALSRREMLVLLAGGVAVASGAAPGRLADFARGPFSIQSDAELDAWVTSRLAEADVRTIAAAWTTRHPAESSAAVLTRAILAGRKGREPLSAYLARTVSAEHRDGRSEEVDGWFLAPTEARLATLLELVRKGAR